MEMQSKLHLSFTSVQRDALAMETYCDSKVTYFFDSESSSQNMFLITKTFERDLFFVCFFDHLVYILSPLSVFFQRCRVCTECGVRGLVLPGSAQWFDNYTVCEGCQRHRRSVCGVCSKATNPSVALQCCSMCHRLAQCTSTIVFIEGSDHVCLSLILFNNVSP